MTERDATMAGAVASQATALRDPYRIHWRLTALVVAVTAVALLTLPPLVVFTLTEVMIFALFASGLNLLLSYSGIVSFGHALYFGIAAYGMAIAIARFGWPMWLGILLGPFTSALFALVFGFLCVQLTAIYAAMLTLACAEVVYAVVFQWFDFTGGDSGISGYVPSMLGLSPGVYGVVVLGVVTAGMLFLWRVVHSPLGLTIRAVGQNPARAAAIGHGRKRVQLIAFVLSGFVCGIAGTLFGVFQGNVFPDYVGVLITVDGLVMVLLGGLYSFAAGIYGALLYKVLDNLISHYFQYWQLVIGLILMAVILLSPSGISGMVQRLLSLGRGGRDG
ncbi:MAG TPA: branched-chain amino acid ABC transporter permease [bacterium]|nr:branched-chain amino acid ABC transporter permease [bacterium]